MELRVEQWVIGGGSDVGEDGTKARVKERNGTMTDMTCP